MKNRTTVTVLSAHIDVLTWESTISKISSWAVKHESRYVCICNSHSVVTAGTDLKFGKVVAEADLVTPDGAPVAWMMRRSGIRQQRINGPDLMWKYCKHAMEHSEPVYLYGGTPEVLLALKKRLVSSFPGIRIVGTYSPPFRVLTDEEDNESVKRINDSGAGTVWVSLGCPKQEKWMAEHRGRINAVMIGVGAAFEYHAGTIARAPLWMQNCGLEWLHRLFSEPRRLWKRYLFTNSVFIFRALTQLIVRRNRR